MPELLREVRAVLAAEESGALLGPALITRCTQLALQLAAGLVEHHRPGDPEVPHGVWHFLHDADLRAREPEYARGQRARVRDLLREPG